MKRIVSIIFATTFLSAGTVFAIDLSNEDSKAYNLRVIEGSTTTNTSINGNATVMSICSGKCQIEIVGGASVDVSKANSAKIKDGKISVK